MFQQWLDILGYSTSSVYNLPNHVHEFLWFLEQHQVNIITGITTDLYDQYYKYLQQRSNTRRGGGLSDAYLNKHNQALVKFIQFMRQTQQVILPALTIPWVEPDTYNIIVITEDEIKSLFAGCDHTPSDEYFQSRDKAMLVIFYSCGLRRNEGYHINVDDINLDNNILHVRKGKMYKQRFVPFTAASADIIKYYLYDHRPHLIRTNSEPAFFISERGERLTAQAMAVRLRLLQYHCDIATPMRLHVLRHSIATHLLQRGMSLEMISQFLGHGSLVSTQVYTHLV